MPTQITILHDEESPASFFEITTVDDRWSRSDGLGRETNPIHHDGPGAKRTQSLRRETNPIPARLMTESQASRRWRETKPITGGNG